MAKQMAISVAKASDNTSAIAVLKAKRLRVSRAGTFAANICMLMSFLQGLSTLLGDGWTPVAKRSWRRGQRVTIAAVKVARPRTCLCRAGILLRY